MAATRHFFHRLLSLVGGDRGEAELAREIEAHLRVLEDKFLADRMSPEEARYAARRAFGGVEQTKEQDRQLERIDRAARPARTARLCRVARHPSIDRASWRRSASRET